MRKIVLFTLLIVISTSLLFAHDENKMTLKIQECKIARAWFFSDKDADSYNRYENLRKAVQEQKNVQFPIHELETQYNQILDRLLTEEDPQEISGLIIQHMEIEQTSAIYTRKKLVQNNIILLLVIGFFVTVTIWLIFVYNSSKHKTQKEKEINNQIMLAQERERRRISQELHDTVAQDIRTSLLYLRNLKETPDNTNLLDKIEGLETQNLKTLRQIIQNLTYDEIETEKFGHLISQHCAEITENRNIPCNFFAQNDVDFDILSTVQKLNIYRIIQEAVNNSLKHANASSISIIARQELRPHKLIFFISDDGCGIDASKQDTETPHFGLDGMKYRAKILNAEIQITSEEEMGTEIKLTIPIN